MSSFFTDVLTDSNDLERSMIGPDYQYWKRIKSPTSLGMSSEGSLSALENDVAGLISYVEVLVSGTGPGTTTGQPLGSQYFLKTGGQCTDVASNEVVDRYLYINNVPMGNIPFISSTMGGGDFSDFRGLVPGTISDLSRLNPMGLFKSFMMGTNPPCQTITMQTINPVLDSTYSDTGVDTTGTDTHYVALADINDMDPCLFSSGVNPVTNSSCVENFDSEHKKPKKHKKMKDASKLPNDIFVRMFFASIGVFGIYILYKLMKKK